MLVCKLLGGGVLLLCGFLYPRLCARDRRAALAQIDALIALVRFIRHCIELYRLPVRDILFRCDEALLAAFGGRQETLAALFENTRWLDSETEAAAKGLARELGRGGFAEQLQICDRALAVLSADRNQKTEGERGRRKTESVLAFGVAALAVILLL